jgi:hypothetical protein
VHSVADLPERSAGHLGLGGLRSPCASATTWAAAGACSGSATTELSGVGEAEQRPRDSPNDEHEDRDREGPRPSCPLSRRAGEPLEEALASTPCRPLVVHGARQTRSVANDRRGTPSLAPNAHNLLGPPLRPRRLLVADVEFSRSGGASLEDAVTAWSNKCRDDQQDDAPDDRATEQGDNAHHGDDRGDDPQEPG